MEREEKRRVDCGEKGAGGEGGVGGRKKIFSEWGDTEQNWGWRRCEGEALWWQQGINVKGAVFFAELFLEAGL